MKRRTSSIYRLQFQRTSLITIIASLIVAMIGGALLVATNVDDLWGQDSMWRTVSRDLGSLLVVSVALALVWELSGKRSFVDELYSKANIAQSIQSSGLGDVIFHVEDINWEELFKSAREVDLFFAYNSQWRTNNEVRLRELASQANVRIRLILPDINNNLTVDDLSRRFNKPVDRLKIKIDEAREQFEKLANFSGEKGAQIEIYVYGLTPHYSVYRFDDTFICALYTQQTEKAYVPHFICHKDGDLFKFFETEINALTTERYSRLVFTNRK